MTKRKLSFVVLGVGVVLAAAYFLKNGEVAPQYESVMVMRGVVRHTVSVSGHVEPVSRIDLAFPIGGRVAEVFFEEGSKVEGGAILMRLDNSAEEAQYEEVYARVLRERFLLEGLLEPLRKEERALKDATVKNAEGEIRNAEDAARATLARAYLYADSAIREKADALFREKRGNARKFGATFSYGETTYRIGADANTEQTLNESRTAISAILAEMDSRKVETARSIEDLLEETARDLSYIDDFLNTLSQVIHRYVSDEIASKAVYEPYQISVTAARTQISTAESEVVAARNAYVHAVSGLTLAMRDLDLSEVGTTKSTISAQEALVQSAEAGLVTVEKRVKDTLLRAPFSGTVTKVTIKAGELTAPYEPVAELLVKDSFEVEAYIPEADIARIELGDRAAVTFDAFEKSDVVSAEVVRIALSETIRDGVPTYKTTFRLYPESTKPLSLRSGMTADIEIYADARENTLYVPVRSVLNDGVRSYVRMYDGAGFVERTVTTGLRGSEGTVEVLTGLKEGEEVVLFVEEV